MAITHLDYELLEKIIKEHAAFLGYSLDADDFTILGFSEGNMAVLSKDGESVIVLENNIKELQEITDENNNVIGIAIVCNTNNSNDPEYELIKLLTIKPEERLVRQQKKIDNNTIIFFKKEKQ